MQQQRVSETKEAHGIPLQEISLVLVSCELQAVMGFVCIVYRCVGRYDLLFPACGSRLVLHLSWVIVLGQLHKIPITARVGVWAGQQRESNMEASVKWTENTLSAGKTILLGLPQQSQG